MTDNGRTLISLEVLKSRAELLTQIRQFMAARQILEVETPYLSNASNPDPNIINLEVNCHIGSKQKYYLHSSPEFPMKRLLSSGLGSIYQIARVFRDGEQGKLHNSEFTMLEWYRIDFDQYNLMDEISELLIQLNFSETEKKSYRDVFFNKLDIDPIEANDDELIACSKANGLNSKEYYRTLCLDFLFSALVTPSLGLNKPCFIYDYPVEHAALAKTRIYKSTQLAERFELFIHGMEIANGYHELNNANELRKRFEDDIQYCKNNNLPYGPIDENLIETTDDLPHCSGVALGIDRLLMAMLNINNIDDVLCFPIAKA